MSEKRQRHQQRRQRRKTQEAKRPRRAEADRLLADMARLAVRDAADIGNGLEAQEWASHLLGIWHRPALPGVDVDAVFLPGFIEELERLGTASALALLRALDAIAAPAYAAQARTAARRLIAAGVPEPSWADELRPEQPSGAVLVYDAAFDDGASVLIEYPTHTLGVYIDHNLGGIVKDVCLAGPPSAVRQSFQAPDVAQRALGLGEARARLEAALSALDHTLDPPVSEDVGSLRALIDARLRALPGEITLPDPYIEVGPEERDALLDDFLASPEGEPWRGDEHAEDVAMLAISFGADYNHGGPLRWSPVVVEIFMLDWLPRKVAREPRFFARLPDVLGDWVRYAGRRRGVPAHLLSEAVAAVEEHRRDMLAAVDDPASWGAAKRLASAALGAGVDLTDAAQMEAFVRRHNDGLAA